MERYIHAGVNKLQLLQLRDIGEFTFVVVAKPALVPEPDPIDVALAQLQKELLESMEKWRVCVDNGLPPLVGSVEVEIFDEDEDGS